MSNWSNKFGDKKQEAEKSSVVDEKENDFPLEDVFYMRIGSGYIHPSRSYEEIELPIFEKYMQFINEHYEPESGKNAIVFEEIDD